MATQVPRRVRLTIPSADKSVLDWIGVQQNVSYSIRQLIRDAIRRDGYTDVTCCDVQQQPKRGRPPKEEYEGESVGSEPMPQVNPKTDANVAIEASESVPVKSVSEPAPQVVKEPAVPPEPPVVAQDVKPARQVSRDDDGFVDPESFFN